MPLCINCCAEDNRQELFWQALLIQNIFFVMRIIATIDNAVIAESQNGKASGCKASVWILKPSACIIATAICVS